MIQLIIGEKCTQEEQIQLTLNINTLSFLLNQILFLLHKIFCFFLSISYYYLYVIEKNFSGLYVWNVEFKIVHLSH